MRYIIKLPMDVEKATIEWFKNPKK